MNTAREADGPHLVALVDDLPRDGRAHDRDPRRPQARAGFRDRVDGRPQAWRVRPDPELPRPRRRRGGREDSGWLDRQDAVAEQAITPGTRDRQGVPRYLRFSARKGRLVVDLIRGKPVVEARTILAYTSGRRPREAYKTLSRQSPTPKTITASTRASSSSKPHSATRAPRSAGAAPRANGRAERINKRTCHITIGSLVTTAPGGGLLAGRRGSAGSASSSRSARVAASKAADTGPAKKASASKPAKKPAAPKATESKVDEPVATEPVEFFFFF